MSQKAVSDTMSRLDTIVDSLAQSQLAQEAPASTAAAVAAEDWGQSGRDAVMRIPVSVQIVLGAVRMPVSKLMSLTRGAIIPLDRKVGDLVDVVVNERIVARGEIVAIDEAADRFAVSVREVVRSGEG